MGRTARWLAAGLAGLAGLLLLGAALDVYVFLQRDETRPADAAIVLGAAVFGDRPSPVLRERIHHAIDLYRAGTVSALIFSGGPGEGDVASEGEIAARYALAEGVPAAAILVESTSTDTWGNLANAAALGRRQGLDSYLVVSTPYHMRRAMLMAADQGLEAYSSPTRTIRWISSYTQSRAFIREVAAYIAYRLERLTS